MKASCAPKRTYQICTRCVMDTSDPWITFDPQGHCNHCTDFLNRRITQTAYGASCKSGLEDFFQQIRASTPSNASHDVIVGVSGGVDSSMVVLLAQKAGLRVLAVHMDNGWDTPISLQNVYRLTKLPNVTYQSEVLHWNNFRSVQRAFIEAGVPDIELPTDIAIQSVVHRVAKEHGIRTILSGGNIANEGILPSSWMYNPRDTTYANAVITSSGIPKKLFSQCKFGFKQELKARLIDRTKTLYPLNQLLYDKELAKKQLKDEIGWKSYGGKHCESTFTRFTQLIYHPKRHGIDFRRGYLSADICIGSTTRESAIKELKKAPWADLNISHDVAFVARKLDYKPDELLAFIDGTPLWYKDFSNRERILQIAYDSFRLITGRTKASNF